MIALNARNGDARTAITLDMFFYTNKSRYAVWQSGKLLESKTHARVQMNRFSKLMSKINGRTSASCGCSKKGLQDTSQLHRTGEHELCIVRASAAETRDIVGAEATAPPVALSGPMQPQHLTSSGPPRPQHLISSVHPPQHLTSSGHQEKHLTSCRHQPQHLTSTRAAAGELTAVEAGELTAVEASSTAAATSTMMSFHR